MTLDRTWGQPESLCELHDERVNESSGVAPSTRALGQFYTHNDSGDMARFFRFDRQGIQATYDLVGAKAVDWEDMASAKLDGKSWLYLGDIGDNGKRRPNITVYRVAEPQGPSGKLTRFDTYTLTYPDGPQNCEALFVHPRNGDLWLVTKDSNQSGVYRLPKPARAGSYRLSKLGVIHPATGLGTSGRLVTGGSVDPMGKHVVLRTYTGALEYTVAGRFDDWWKAKPEFVRMPLDVQGEAVTYSRDGRSLVTTSEGSPCPVSILTLQ